MCREPYGDTYERSSRQSASLVKMADLRNAWHQVQGHSPDVHLYVYTFEQCKHSSIMTCEKPICSDVHSTLGPWSNQRAHSRLVVDRFSSPTAPLESSSRLLLDIPYPTSLYQESNPQTSCMTLHVLNAAYTAACMQSVYRLPRPSSLECTEKTPRK